MQKTPVTVLMTVRNGEPYVKDAIQSILTQTYGDFKFLVLDNASTDQTREIIHSFGDARIEPVDLDRDLKQVGALNHGLSLIQSLYVARIDADDISHPTRLQNQIDFVLEHPQIGLLGTWYEAIDSSNQVLARYSPPIDQDQLSTLLFLNNPFAHSSVLFDRQAAIACGGYNTKFTFAHDYALWLQIASQHSIAILPSYLTQIRKHPRQWGVNPSVACQRARETIEVIFPLANALALQKGLSWLPRKAQGSAYLRYATSLSKNALPLKALFWLVRGILRDPFMLLSNASTIAHLILHAILWKRALTVIKKTKQILSNNSS